MQKKNQKFIYKIFKKKLADKSGFSLAETLLATLIMLLATGLLTGTLSLAGRNFERSTNESEAQLMLSTLCNYIESELNYAEFQKDTSTASGLTENSYGAVTFKSDVHEMGTDAYFVVMPTTGTKNRVSVNAKSEKSEGKICEVSPNYEDGEFFDIAGVKLDEDRALTAGMTMRLGDDEFSIEVSVWVSDKDGEKLTERSLRIIPEELV